jgi:hypothetical protein
MFSLFKLLPCFLKFSIFSFLFGLAVNCAVLRIICLSLFESVYFWSFLVFGWDLRNRAIQPYYANFVLF